MRHSDLSCGLRQGTKASQSTFFSGCFMLLHVAIFGNNIPWPQPQRGFAESASSRCSARSVFLAEHAVGVGEKFIGSLSLESNPSASK